MIVKLIQRAGILGGGLYIYFFFKVGAVCYLSELNPSCMYMCISNLCM